MTAGAVLYVSDLVRMRTFYQRCFGLSVALGTNPDSELDSDLDSDLDGEAADFCILIAPDGSWDLSLVQVPSAVTAQFVVTDPPRRREQTPIKLAFVVASIEAVGPVVAAAGGRLDPPSSAWDFRGHRHLDALDPEGNVIALRELLGD